MGKNKGNDRPESAIPQTAGVRADHQRDTTSRDNKMSQMLRVESMQQAQDQDSVLKMWTPQSK